MTFSRQIQGGGAASWENTSVVRSAPSYDNIFQTAGAVAGEVFSGMAVDDLLGDGSIPTTSVSNPLDPAQPSAVSHTRGIPNIEDISGLRGIRAAREQGLMSGTRAQTLATRRLNEALNQYPQYRDQLLKAYDNLVAPIGNRADSIFDATQDEKMAAEQAKQDQANQRKALEAGYADYAEYVFYQQKMRLQAEETARQDIKYQDQENVLSARGIELTNNIYRGSSLVAAELGGFITEKVMTEGGLSPQVIAQLDSQLTISELQAKAKLASFKVNPQFDYDNNLEQLEGMYNNLRSLVKDNSAQAKTQALLEQLKVASEADQWTRAPAVATLLAMGNSSGLDMINAMQRITGDVAGNKNIKEQMEALIGDPQQVMKFKNLIEQGMASSDFSKEELDFFTNTLNSVKGVITDKEEREVMVQRMVEMGIKQTQDVMDGTTPPPPIDEVTSGAVAVLADPKYKSHFETEQGREIAKTAFNNTIATLESQIRQEAMGSDWEIDDSGKVVGGMLEFSPARQGAAWSGTTRSDKSFLPTQNTLVNDVLVKATKLHPQLLGEGVSADDFKQQLVNRLNAISKPEREEPIENAAQRELQRMRNEERNMSTREWLDGLKERMRAGGNKLRESVGLDPIQRGDSPDVEESPAATSFPLEPTPVAVGKEFPGEPSLIEELKSVVPALRNLVRSRSVEIPSDDEKAIRSLMPGIEQAETGSGEKWIRTKAPEKNTSGSSAYGPLQITKSTVESVVSNWGHILTPEEKEYAERFIAQGELFLKFGREPDKEGYESKYEYGGAGDLGDTKEDREMYYLLAYKVLQAKAMDLAKRLKRNPNSYEVVKAWRGKGILDDPRYFKEAFGDTNG